MKDVLKKYSLKTRLYLGPTSVDDSLTFIFSNIAQLKSGMMCFEPFIGTGSIAIALTHLGGICFGCDIDPRVLRGDMYAGKDRPETREHRDVFTNFRQYKLPLPEIVRMDHHLLDRHFLLQTPAIQQEGLFHVIVTDPPYGIRAGARKSGRKDEMKYTITPESRHDHIPTTQTYAVEEVMLDLLHSAATTLVL
jgi:tRNA (guanine10-N2)-methyltransferase